MIIDAHQHACWHGRDEESLLADMNAHGIDLAWLLTWEIPPEEDSPAYHGHFNPEHVRTDGTHAGLTLSDVLRARRRYPGRFVAGYCPPPTLRRAPELLQAACRMHGVRVCGEWKYRILLDDPRCLELFRKAGELRCPVVVHLDAPYLPDPQTARPTYQREWYGGTVGDLSRALAACPETTFIGHAPGFWREISGDADTRSEMYPAGPIVPGGRLEGLFEAHANLCADLSATSALNALQRDPAYARELLCRWADRLLFGRDWYGGALLEFLASIDLPGEVREKILAGNARRLIGG
jgi:hypothetical protein